MTFMAEDPDVGSGLHGSGRTVVDDDELGTIVFQRLKAFRKRTVSVVGRDDDTQIHELST
jgi:hypothetical protein